MILGGVSILVTVLNDMRSVEEGFSADLATQIVDDGFSVDAEHRAESHAGRASINLIPFPAHWEQDEGVEAYTLRGEGLFVRLPVEEGHYGLSMAVRYVEGLADWELQRRLWEALRMSNAAMIVQPWIFTQVVGLEGTWRSCGGGGRPMRIGSVNQGRF
ncbi:hypothetical protein ANO11243_093020 [Dothideomycetidae sp. 11243]|nr:hypothetical protein ANO11243_093020 [fungal sp. No.11243]